MATPLLLRFARTGQAIMEVDKTLVPMDGSRLAEAALKPASEMTPVVLVVEDEADLVVTYERILRRMGQPVATASTRAQALAIIQARPLRLVISDLRLPDGSGMDVVRAARETHAPVIVVTGDASEPGRREAFEAGAAAYLGKPFAVSCFRDLVGRHTAPAGELEDWRRLQDLAALR